MKRNKAPQRTASSFPLIFGIFIMAGLTIASVYINRSSMDNRSAAYPAQIINPEPLPEYSYGMVYYSQLDPLWASNPVPIGVGDCSFASIGCGTSVTASVLSTWVDAKNTPDYVHKMYFPWLSCSGFAASESVRVLTSQGIGNMQIKKNIKTEVIKHAKLGKKILIGGPIKKPTGSTIYHQTLVVGYDATKEALVFNDPYFGKALMLEVEGYVIDWNSVLAYVLK